MILHWIPSNSPIFTSNTKYVHTYNEQVYRQRSLQYGPVFKEKLANFTTVVISDPAEYNKVVRAEGKYPLRRDVEPWFLYREKRKMGQGLVNS